MDGGEEGFSFGGSFSHDGDLFGEVFGWSGEVGFGFWVPVGFSDLEYVRLRHPPHGGVVTEVILAQVVPLKVPRSGVVVDARFARFGFFRLPTPIQFLRHWVPPPC